VSKTAQTATAAPAAAGRRPRAPRQFHAFRALTWASWVVQARNFSSLFFGFLFPLIFISVFGLFTAQGPTKINLGVIDGSDTTSPVYQSLAYIRDHPDDPEIKKLQLTLTLPSGPRDTLLADLRKGDLDGVIGITPVTRTVTPPTLPSPAASPSPSPAAGVPPAPATPRAAQGTVQGYDVALTTSLASPQSAAGVSQLLAQIDNQVNLRASGVTTLPVQMSADSVQGKSARYVDFIIPGQIGFSLLSIAVFGTAFGFVVLKRTLVLKRIFATPTRPTTIVLAQGTSRLLIALAQVLVLLGAAVYLPFIQFRLADGLTTFTEMIVVAIFGLICFLGLGLIIAGLFNNEQALGPVINLVTLPQFLLSGVFFSTDAFPGWIQPIANNLPLSFLNTALRKIANEGATLYDVRLQLLGLAIWGVVTYTIAIRTFKWE